MLLFKYVALLAGWGALLAAVAMLARDIYKLSQHHKQKASAPPDQVLVEPEVRWRFAGALAAAAFVAMLISSAIVVVPSGYAGVRVSQISGTRPGTLYPGVHLVKPMVDEVVLYDVRDRVYTTAGGEEPMKKGEVKEKAPEAFRVQSREGLGVGMSITVRYRLDAQRLDHIHANVAQPVEQEIVPPVVASIFREIVPRYTVREVFAVKRDELTRLASDAITRRLAQDGIVVKEVMVRDIILPPEYAKGLEQLLMKEQHNEGLKYETEIQEKQVRIAELQAEAAKARQVKQAEADAQTRVLGAKGEADSMKYLLPLKQQQIEQTRLEAEAQKESTVKNAEAAALAKVIDSKAELERRNLLSQAEANRIRLTAAADAERMQAEAAVLKQNPLLINKIMAERLSDKIQVMMVPTDGNFFFKDMLGSMTAPRTTDAPAAEPPYAPAPPKATRAQTFR